MAHSWLISIIYFLSSAFQATYSDCTWTVDGNTLDLSCLKGKLINVEDDAGHLYKWSLCENNAGSCSGGQPLMVRQVLKSDPTNFCYEIGSWDTAINPTYSSANVAWSFDYENGGSCQGELVRSWSPTFVCDKSAHLKAGTVSEMLGSCRYSIEMRTKFACPDTECILNPTSGLSAGWVFIILLICGLFTYCFVGYVVKAVTVNKHDGLLSFNTNNIPHRGFWRTLPAYVVAGCTVTKEVIVNFVDGKRSRRRYPSDEITAPMTSY